MQPIEITCFTVTLFLALAALLLWKHRRDAAAARLTRGLRGYVDASSPAPLQPRPETHGEELITV